MKLLSFFIILVLSFCFHYSEAQKKDAYHISVKIKGLEENKSVQLANYYGNQFLKADSAIVTNGVAEFKGKEPLKGGMYVIVLSPSKYYDILISGTEPEFSLEADTSDFVGSVKFNNSKENELLFSYRKFIAEKSKDAVALQKEMAGVQGPEEIKATKVKMKALQDEVQAYMKNTVQDNQGMFAAKIIKANIEPELSKEIPVLANGRKDSTFLFRQYKQKFFENIDFSDDRMLRTPFLQTKLEKYFKDLVYQVKDSIVVDADRVLKLSKKNKDVYRYVLWTITNKYENIDIVGLDGVFIHLAEEYYLKDADWLDSTQRAKFKERVETLKPIETGNLMPPLILQDTLGRDVNLYDVKANYTIVYFYRYNCGHCQDHAPALVKFYEDNKSKGIEVFHVGVHEVFEPVEELKETKKFIKKYKTDKLINVLDSKIRYDFKKKYDVYVTPTIFVLDREKRIIGKRVPLEDLNGFIDFYEKKQESLKLHKKY